jgi:hypothetical protein
MIDPPTTPALRFPSRLRLCALAPLRFKRNDRMAQQLKRPFYSDIGFRNSFGLRGFGFRISPSPRGATPVHFWCNSGATLVHFFPASACSSGENLHHFKKNSGRVSRSPHTGSADLRVDEFQIPKSNAAFTTSNRLHSTIEPVGCIATMRGSPIASNVLNVKS